MVAFRTDIVTHVLNNTQDLDKKSNIARLTLLVADFPTSSKLFSLEVKTQRKL
jgi:hypothetical protein